MCTVQDVDFSALKSGWHVPHFFITNLRGTGILPDTSSLCLASVFSYFQISHILDSWVQYRYLCRYCTYLYRYLCRYCTYQYRHLPYVGTVLTSIGTYVGTVLTSTGIYVGTVLTSTGTYWNHCDDRWYALLSFRIRLSFWLLWCLPRSRVQS